jgi:hypothetical protein
MRVKTIYFWHFWTEVAAGARAEEGTAAALMCVRVGGRGARARRSVTPQSTERILFLFSCVSQNFMALTI